MELVTPLWLAASAVAVLPVVIHLIRNERFQRCELATVRFLAAAVRAQKGRRQISNWLLLLVRMAIVVAVAFLLARPFRTGAESSFVPAKEALVLVDVSGSQARQGGPDLVTTVRETVADLPADGQVTLARFAQEIEAVPDGQPWQAIPGAATDYSRAVEWAIDRRTASGNPGRVIFVSDFSREAVRRVSPRLWPSGTTVEFKSTGELKAWNLGVERIELLTPGAVSEVELEVTLRASGPIPHELIAVHLQIAGVAEPLEQILPSGQMHARFRWKTTIPAEGLLWQGSAEVVPPTGDAVAGDNVRPFAFSVARPRSVLLVDGDPGQSTFDGEVYYLDQALKSVVREDEVPLFQTTVRARLGDPTGFDVVALCNLAALSLEDETALRSYLSAGGNLFFSSGARTTPAVFDSLTAAGVTFGKVSRKPEPAFHGSVLAGSDHPVFRMMKSGAGEAWRQIAFWESLDLQLATNCKVLATFDNGVPLFVEAAPLPAGGRALALLHSVDRQDSEFPREPLFLPWARETFRYLSRAAEPRWVVKEVAPSFVERRAAGVYVEGSAVTIVAPSPGEIDLTPASMDEVRAAFGVSALISGHEALSPEGPSLAGQALHRERPHEWWPFLALAVFVLLVVESLLAARGQTHHLPRGTTTASP